MSHFPRCLSWRLAAWVVLSLFAWTGRSQAQHPPRSEVLVEVTRGSLVESRHHGQLVAVTPEGRVLLAVGDPHTLVFPRSSLKPLQALATVALALEQGIELPTEEIAILCASHAGHDYHVAAVQRVLQRAQAEDRHLYCGAGSDLHATHGCSGKHSGMLLQASLSGEPLEDYWKVEHPVQRRIQQAIGEFTDYREPLAWGTDGCGVPNYVLPLDRLALGFARLSHPEAAPEKYRAAARAIRAAMLAHPELLSERGSFDAQLIASSAGKLVGKSGAEACFCISWNDPPMGLAIKIEDGNPRGISCVILQALAQLKALTAEMEVAVGSQRIIPVLNTLGERVGEIRAAAWASAARQPPASSPR